MKSRTRWLEMVIDSVFSTVLCVFNDCLFKLLKSSARVVFYKCITCCIYGQFVKQCTFLFIIMFNNAHKYSHCFVLESEKNYSKITTDNLIITTTTGFQNSRLPTLFFNSIRTIIQDSNGLNYFFLKLSLPIL